MQQSFVKNNSKTMMLWIALLLLAMVPAAAQTNSGAITGVIQDAQGAVIANAKVTVVNTEQGAGSAREITSNGEGVFLITPLPPSTYTLTVEVTGFKKYTQSGIVVNANDRLGLPSIALEVGSTGESVTVEANVVQLAPAQRSIR
jgi:hypothetical protein